MASTVWLLTAILCSASFVEASAAENDSPYRMIASRNMFHIGSVIAQLGEVKPPPPKLRRVLVTGLTDLGGKRRVCLEIGDPGKTIKRPVLSEGDTSETVEVLQVDVPLGQVKLRIGGLERVLSFESSGKGLD
jgi:hypothetical protein